MKKVLIIGAGLGGLAAACRLARDGHSVTVLERNSRAGGKVNLIESGGYKFDTGASLLTMKHVFEELFDFCGIDIKSRLEFEKLDLICRYRWRDGTRLDASADLVKTEEQIAQVSPEDVVGFRRYLKDSEKKLRIAEKTFLSRSLNDLPGLLRPKFIPDLLRISSTRTLASHNKRYFKSGKLRQLFDRFATYNGSSPYKIPATFSLIPYAEFGLGAWYVRGGIYTIPRELERLAGELGAEFRFGCAVDEISVENGSVRGVRTDSGEFLEADIVIANSDAIETYRNLIKPDARKIYGDRKIGRIQPSCSGFVLLLGANRKFPQLAHHNIFFSDDYKAEFEAIFGTGTVPENPTIYVCSSSRTDPTQAPEGSENLFILLNVPSTGNVDWEQEKEPLAERVISVLESFGLNGLRDSTEFRHSITPEDFEAKYRANRGSIYGASSNGILSAFMRVPNKAKDIEGLYFVGGTTHPGGGMPLVLLSARMAAEMIGGE